MSEQVQARTRLSMLRSPRRLLLAALGLVCVGLAFAGVAIPGLPTTVFLIAASFLFAKSCPWLEERLVRHRVFRPYLRYIEGSEPLPGRDRVRILVLMWAAVSLSLAMLALGGSLTTLGAATIVAAAAVGSVFVLTWRRAPRPARTPPGDSAGAAG